MVRNFAVAASALVLVVLLYIAGCSNTPNGAPPKEAPGQGMGGALAPGNTDVKEAKGADEHGHKAGGHGGTIVSLGRDNYHVEAVFEKGGTVRLYLLGKDEARVEETEIQPLQAFAKAEGDNEARALELKATPQKGDAPGKTSLFLGQLPRELAGKKVEVTVPSIRIGSERFRLGFASAEANHTEEMPVGTEGADARQLYLTPGGIYTEADIKANGHMTAAQKYQGFQSSHDMKPRPGDKICPVTLTKANPKCTWIVAGKTYEFCCPPCIDEFMQQARENPAAIKGPAEYLQK